MDTLEAKTCRACGRDATHWVRSWSYAIDYWGEVRYFCDGHAQVHITVPSEQGRSWGRVGEDDVDDA